MIYSLQHNNGKTHLLDIESNTLCGHNGGLHTPDHSLKIDHGYFEVTDNTEIKISTDLTNIVYCKKCLNKSNK